MTEHINSLVGRLDPDRKYIVGYLSGWGDDIITKYTYMTGKEIKEECKGKDRFENDFTMIAEGKMLWQWTE